MNCLLILIIALMTSQGVIGMEQANLLWYEQPANKWMESLPIGNGRLGAMTFGGIQDETIALNESGMWSGEFDENQQHTFKEEQYDRLAEHVRRHVNLPLIYQILTKNHD